MKALHLLSLLLFFCLTDLVAAQESKTITLEPGTPARKSICDEMRKYLRYAGYAELTTGHFVFKIGRLAILDDYCVFEGYPMNPDGTSSPEVPDIDYVVFLKKSKDAGTGWVVIADLSRSDVPADEELKQIRRSFPKEIPDALISDFWRERLR